MGFRTKLEQVLVSERIQQNVLHDEMVKYLVDVNRGITEEKEKVVVINKSNLSQIVTGKKWRVTELTARRIWVMVNKLKIKNKDKYKILDLFEEDRLMFIPKENE